MLRPFLVITMIDFHSHILPKMDDGSDSIAESLKMLRESFAQGVDTLVATSHFYADEEYPADFLSRRKHRFDILQEAMRRVADVFPDIIPGAEVLYFPGIGSAEEITQLKIAGSDAILIEPPMVPWRDSMLDEIADLRKMENCRPVIAHVDRYMKYLNDTTLIDRVLERDMLVQVNASYFLNPRTARMAFRNLKAGKIHVIGSDCHNMTDRLPNIGAARRAAVNHKLSTEFSQLTRNSAQILGLKGILP